MPRIAYGNEEYFIAQYPNMPDDRVYALLAVAAANPDVHKKELNYMLIKKLLRLRTNTVRTEHRTLYSSSKVRTTSITNTEILIGLPSLW